jgi:sugar/nucleoside kinase (ribokinase family)
MGSINYVVYGKIIVDDVHLPDGRAIRGKLGGGGPQAAFGARLWDESVGVLSRSGTDLQQASLNTLRGLKVDLQGWRQVADIPTPHCVMRYDGEEGLVEARLTTSQEDWDRLLAEELRLPDDYLGAKALHLVTEFPGEQLVRLAMDLRSSGLVLSLEPLLTAGVPNQLDGMRTLLRYVDVVTPDWAAARLLAENDDPRTVVERLSDLGPKLVAVRHGRHGSYLWDPSGRCALHVPAPSVRVADPTGAGNAYGGGLCVGWVKTGDAATAGSWATASAAVLICERRTPTMGARVRREARGMAQHVMSAIRPL